jgi:hypothetical protein
MKVRNFSTTFSIATEGDTGYDNKSSLIFYTRRGGKVVMPLQAWKANDFPVKEVVKMELKIPSGNLLIENLGDSSIESSQENGVISFFGDYCRWDGKIAGLLGGMSGYGNHEIDAQEAFVYEGTYLIPKNYFNGLDSNDVVLEKYLQRLATANALSTYEDRVEYDKARISGNVSDQEWLEYIRKLDKAYIPAMSSYEISQTIAYRLKEEKDIRPLRCEGGVSDREWSEFVDKLQQCKMKY